MEYKYTKPREAIAAMYSSPGPCYALPGLIGQKGHDPRSDHTRGAAFPFGIRHGKFKDDCSPGPCYYPDPKYTKNGPEGEPKYSLYSRQQYGTASKTPGPGAYSPEAVGPMAHFRHPAFVFGARHRHRQMDSAPAANSYSLPLMIGKTAQSSKRQAPCYSLTGRSKVGAFSEDMAHAPGPGTYNTTPPDVNKVKSPHYSMTSRNVMPGDATQKPGPGAHSPETVIIHKRQSPHYSFGIRHSQYTAPLIVDPPEC